MSYVESWQAGNLGSARPPDGRMGVRMPNAARPEAGPYPQQFPFHMHSQFRHLPSLLTT
jgi:hypothetical protein